MTSTPTRSCCSSIRVPARAGSCTPNAATGLACARSTWTSTSVSDGERIPAPYEVLLYAAMQGDQSDFTREDSVEETWRILDPLVASNRATRPLRPRNVGPGRRRTADRGLRRMAPTMAASPVAEMTPPPPP